MDTGRVEAALKELEASDERFDWVGVYWVEGEDLVLGPFVGAPTEHIRITIPNGVCGSVAAAGATEVVPDVRARPGHIACDLKTRAEVVAPIIVDGAVIGVLDVDSNTLGAFDPATVQAIEGVASQIARM
jgi:L-methionine (R)-S-oxide reductase